jgi:hypothetical protein
VGLAPLVLPQPPVYILSWILIFSCGMITYSNKIQVLIYFGHDAAYFYRVIRWKICKNVRKIGFSFIWHKPLVFYIVTGNSQIDLMMMTFISWWVMSLEIVQHVKHIGFSLFLHKSLFSNVITYDNQIKVWFWQWSFYCFGVMPL